MSTTVDLYLVATPLFGLLGLFTIIALKVALKRITDFNPHHFRKPIDQPGTNEEGQKEKSPFQTNETLKVFSFFAKTQTFLEPCMIKRSKNKLPLLFVILLIGILSFCFPEMYFFCLVGAPLAFCFVLTQSCFEVNKFDDNMQRQQINFDQTTEQVKLQEETEHKKKYIYIALAILSCGMSLVLCGLTYKNFTNSFLGSFLLTFLINTVLDLFCVRFIMFFVFSYILTLNLRIQIHIQEENLRNKIYNSIDQIEKIEVKETAIRLSPQKKKQSSPTKVPKVQKMQKENVDQETLNTAIQIVKKIKKQKKTLPSLMTPVNKKHLKRNQEAPMEECSLNQLMEKGKGSEDKFNQNQTPRMSFNFDQEQNSVRQSDVNRRRKNSQLVIIEVKNKEEYEEKQEKEENLSIQEEKKEEECSKNDYKKRIGSFLHSNLDFDEGSFVREDRKDSEDDFHALKIMKSFDEKIEDEEFSGEDNDEMRVSRKNKELKDNFKSNKAGLLCINEQEERQFEELDMNSPEKRRKNRQIEEYIGQYCKRKSKGKNISFQSKRRQIQFTSGEPYLEYLPKMLNKEVSQVRINQPQNTKKSQPNVFRSDIQMVQQKERKSLNKIRTRRQPKATIGINNENECPETIEIEDL